MRPTKASKNPLIPPLSAARRAQPTVCCPPKTCLGGVEGPTCVIGDPLTRMAHSPGRSALLVDPCREVALLLRAACRANPGPVPQTRVAPRGRHSANRLVTSTRPVKRLPLKCHSPEGGTRFHVRKTFLTWSPLTESNRRPSPYHVSLRRCAAPGRAADLPEHEHRQALTSTRRALPSAVCHSICHSD